MYGMYTDWFAICVALHVSLMYTLIASVNVSVDGVVPGVGAIAPAPVSAFRSAACAAATSSGFV